MEWIRDRKVIDAEEETIQRSSRKATFFWIATEDWTEMVEE